jgi:hypothetical protein
VLLYHEEERDRRTLSVEGRATTTMALADLLPAIRALPHDDKLRLMQDDKVQPS